MIKETSDDFFRAVLREFKAADMLLSSELQLINDEASARLEQVKQLAAASRTKAEEYLRI